MGRMLTVAEYGLFNALIALVVVAGTPLQTLMMVISRQVSAYSVQQSSGSIYRLYNWINVRASLFSLVVIAVALLYIEEIQGYLKSSGNTQIYLLGAVFFLLFPRIINKAFLQGLQHFKWLSASDVLTVLFQLIAAVVLVWFGFGVGGVLGGIILSNALVWLITYAVLHRTLVSGRGSRHRLSRVPLGSVLPILIANTALVAMTQLDIVFVKIYFTQQEAGLYAAAAILGKAVMYLSGGIAMALFPMASENHFRGTSSSHLLTLAVGLTIVLCGLAALVYFLFGEWLIALLYGENYSDSGQLLKYFGLAMFPMALVVVVVNFLIANGRFFFAYLFLAVAPLQIGAIYLFHDSLLTVVSILGISGLVLTVIGYGYLWWLELWRPASIKN